MKNRKTIYFWLYQLMAAFIFTCLIIVCLSVKPHGYIGLYLLAIMIFAYISITLDEYYHAFIKPGRKAKLK